MMCVWLTATVLSQSIVREPGNGQRDHHKLQAYPIGARMEAEQIDLEEVDRIRGQLARLLQGGHALACEHYREHHQDGGVDAEKELQGQAHTESEHLPGEYQQQYSRGDDASDQL